MQDQVLEINKKAEFTGSDPLPQNAYVNLSVACVASQSLVRGLPTRCIVCPEFYEPPSRAGDQRV